MSLLQSPKTSPLFVLVLIAFSVSCTNRDQQQFSSHKAHERDHDSTAADRHVIRIGDNIDIARDILDKFEKPNIIGGLSLANLPLDIENIYVRLDPNHMSGCIWYSKSSREITRFSVICFPHHKSGKLRQSWIPVESMELNVNGTHSITFCKPLTIEEFDASKEKPKTSEENAKKHSKAVRHTLRRRASNTLSRSFRYA